MTRMFVVSWVFVLFVRCQNAGTDPFLCFLCLSWPVYALGLYPKAQTMAELEAELAAARRHSQSPSAKAGHCCFSAFVLMFFAFVFPCVLEYAFLSVSTCTLYFV